VSDLPRQIADVTKQAVEERIHFLKTDLELCFTFTSLAATEYKIGHRAHAVRAINDAEKGYATILRFMNDSMPEDVRRELQEQAERLRKTLDELRENIIGAEGEV
jgi:hypothetical protein